MLVASSAEVLAAENILTRLNGFLQTETFKATFTQQVYDERKSLIGDSIGTVIIQRPRKFRWEYLQPSRQLIISDGTNLINYDPELEQAVIQPLIVSLGYTPIMLLSGEALSQDNFEINMEGHHDGLDWISLVPKVKDTEFTRIELGLDQTTLMRMRMYDHFQQLTLIRFLRSQFDVDIETGAFRVYLPPGTDMIGEYTIP